MDKCIIYGLYCPITDELHYIGKSTKLLIRPLQHLTKSHSDKINEWVKSLKFLNYKPIIKILEKCNENNIDDREEWWIRKSIEDGCFLLNVQHNRPNDIIEKYHTNNGDIMEIAMLIKKEIEKTGITREKLAIMSNISRPTLHDIENGNKRISYKNLEKVLNILGYRLTAVVINNNST